MPSTESQEFLETLRAGPVPAVSPGFPQIRAAFGASMAARPLPDGAIVETTSYDGVPCEVLSCVGTDATKLVLCFHGGGRLPAESLKPPAVPS